MALYINLHTEKLTNVIIWEMHGFSHKFPQYRKMQPMVWGKSEKLIFILFPWYGFFCSIRFASYGILYYMGNTWVSPSISHSPGKCNKTHRMGWTWEIGTHTFPIVCVIFSHMIPIQWDTSSNGKCMDFPINFP